MEYLVANSTVVADEDSGTEFKAHRDLAIEELPAWASEEKGRKLNRSRQPVSKTIAGFLNSLGGGTVWMGIGDSGEVQGLRLSLLQKDHLRLALRDLAARYDPPVPLARLRLRFVPVRGEAGAEEAWEAEPPLSEGRTELVHTLRSPTCACDEPGEAGLGLWVVQLEVAGSPSLSPVFRNEEGLVYARVLSSNIQLNAEAIADLARNQILNNLPVPT